MKKAILIVMDSAGIGALPDAALYGDAGCNTFQSIAEAVPQLELPYLNGMGLYKLVPQFQNRTKADIALPSRAARMAELSKGKDTITGHWELAGIITEEPSPTFPDGFPEELLKQLYDACGVEFIGNEVASGTEIIARLGAEHIRTGKPILYTSADSVLQIAAHEEIIPLERLYEICSAARELTRTGPYKVGRVIARPFIGEEGAFVRTANRHDYSLLVPEANLLVDLLKQQHEVMSVGKIEDIFANVTFTKAIHTKSNDDGMNQTMQFYGELKQGLLFVNLVDFDMKYGHRRDCAGYGEALEAFDARLGQLLDVMDEETILILTADHGCDPAFKGTDHTREYVPLFLCGKPVRGMEEGSAPATYTSFADLAATLAQYFGIAYSGAGNSFAEEVFV